MLISSFVPFVFKIRTLNETESESRGHDEQQFISIRYCDTNKNTRHFYFFVTLVYVILVMLIPISILIVCNTLIVIQVVRAHRRRKEKLLLSLKRKAGNFRLRQLDQLSRNQELLRHKRRVITNLNFLRKSHQVTATLSTISFSYALLNLPYFIAWCFFYYNAAIKVKVDVNERERILDYSNQIRLFAIINISEIFYVLNFGMHFVFYCLSGNLNRTRYKCVFVFKWKATKKVKKKKNIY